jgi:hypothetical protein
MTPDAWLIVHAPGYEHLSFEEREATKDFALLWSLFESRCLGENASADRIVTAIKNLQSHGRLNLAPFSDQIDYFFNRYHDGAQFTGHFSGLRLRKNDQPQLVQDALTKKASNDITVLATLLIIIYRLRNNLLHGHKWSYEIKGQLANFKNANQSLMSYMEHYCP